MTLVFVQMVRSSVLPPLPLPPSTSRCRPVLTPIRVHVFTSSIPTVEPDTWNLLLFNRRPIGSGPPRTPAGYDLARVHSHPSNAGPPFRCHFVPPDRNSAGSVRGRVERLPHGVLGISKTGVRKLLRRLTKDLPAFPPPLPSCIRVYPRSGFVWGLYFPFGGSFSFASRLYYVLQ